MGRLLLVGNSRWHWGQRLPQGLTCWHESAPEAAAALLASPTSQLPSDLEAWACVGHLPVGAPLPPERRITLAQVPLLGLPPWLGVDRALVGWRAWCRQGRQPVLVVDAGTCLSLTRIDGRGHFRGGRLSAGFALQLRSLGLATEQLPALHPGDLPALDPWPLATGAAMEQGCLQACAAAVVQAVADLQPEPGADQGWRLWLTGGDGERLEPLLRQRGLEPQLAPNLALEALAALAAQPPALS